MWEQPRSSASFLKIGHSLRRKDSTTPRTSFKKPSRIKVEGTLPTPKTGCHNGGEKILCQPSSSRVEKGRGKRDGGRF